MCPTDTRSLSFREAYNMLVKPGDGPVSRHLNRHISIRISLFLVRRGAFVSPMAMTLLSFTAALAGAFLLVMGWPFLGGLMAQLASILDGCDGEIARLTGQTSKKGGLADSVLDRVADISLVLALGILAYWAGPPPCPFLAQVLQVLSWPMASLLLTALALSGSLMVSYCAAITRALAPVQLRRVVGSRDVRLFLIMLAGVACQFYAWAASLALALLALLTWAEVGHSLAQAPRQIEP
ncbi:hypothetical protein DRO33_00015 [Candidatus Bathyarchaeota archaeon]|nr:MAG: hypothetical protein DRO33_00015 [Candidatus Bathyarchaeota archaeon]